jgi:hypothetical protein
VANIKIAKFQFNLLPILSKFDHFENLINKPCALLKNDAKIHFSVILLKNCLLKTSFGQFRGRKINRREEIF